MNFRRLQYFVKIVDVGSLTQAADILHVAQPALSQQLATLEAEVRQKLLVRTKRGVTPTEAGTVLYRHAHLILRQCEQARADMKSAGQGLSGAVSVGLAPGTAAADLAVPLLRTVRERHPGVVLYLNETYGTTLSELIMTGRMDLAVLYGGTTAVHGLAFGLLLFEPLYLVGPLGMPGPADPVRAARDRGHGAVPAASLQRGAQDGGRRLRRGRDRAARRRRDRIGRNPDRGDRRGPRRDHPAGIDGAARAGGLSRLAVADRRAGDRGAARALPVRPPAAVGAGAGGEGDPARARRASCRGPCARPAGKKVARRT